MCNRHIRLPLKKKAAQALSVDPRATEEWPKCWRYVKATLHRNPHRASVFSSSSSSSSPSSFTPLRPHFSVSPASRHCRTDFPLGFPPQLFRINLSSPDSPDFCVSLRTSLIPSPEAHQASNQPRTQLWGWTQPRCCRRCCCFWAPGRFSKVSRATDAPLSGQRTGGFRGCVYNDIRPFLMIVL